MNVAKLIAPMVARKEGNKMTPDNAKTLENAARMLEMIAIKYGKNIDGKDLQDITRISSIVYQIAQMEKN